MSLRFMLEVAYFGQNQASFREASDMIGKVMELELNEETVREVTELIGSKIHDKDTLQAQQEFDNMCHLEQLTNPKKMTLYIMTDGASVNTRVKDANGSSWRENKTVMAFTDKGMIRRKDGSHIITRKEYASFIGSAEEFRKYVWDIAVRNGYGQVERVVVIADGATWIRNMCNELFPDAVQILDLYHLKENVFDYSKWLFKGDESKYTPWAEATNARLEAGQVEEVIQSIAENITPPANVVNLHTYLENNRHKMNYPEYKKCGFFVGSGAIESANKIIVQRRLKQSGMRWGVRGAQCVLTLRAKVESGLWKKEAQWFQLLCPIRKIA